MLRSGRSFGIPVHDPYSLPGCPVGTVCTEIQPVHRHLDQGSDFFCFFFCIYFVPNGTSVWTSVNSLTYGYEGLSHCRDTGVGVTRSGIQSTG